MFVSRACTRQYLSQMHLDTTRRSFHGPANGSIPVRCIWPRWHVHVERLQSKVWGWAWLGSEQSFSPQIFSAPDDSAPDDTAPCRRSSVIRTWPCPMAMPVSRDTNMAMPVTRKHLGVARLDRAGVGDAPPQRIRACPPLLNGGGGTSQTTTAVSRSHPTILHANDTAHTRNPNA